MDLTLHLYIFLFHSYSLDLYSSYYSAQPPQYKIILYTIIIYYNILSYFIHDHLNIRTLYKYESSL